MSKKKVSKKNVRKPVKKATKSRVLALVNSPQRWTRGAHARDNRGRSVDPDEGCSWCALGALMKLGMDTEENRRKLKKAAKDTFGIEERAVQVINDVYIRSYKDFARWIRNAGL